MKRNQLIISILIVICVALVIGFFIKDDILDNRVSTTVQNDNLVQSDSEPEQYTPPEPHVAKFDAKNAVWTQISGDANDFCTSPTFKGVAEVRGWMDIVYSDVGGNESILHITGADAKKLPYDLLGRNYQQNLDFSKDFSLFVGNLTPQSEKELRAATKERPKTITITSFNIYCEGYPSVQIEI